jgi:hypothetical protein
VERRAEGRFDPDYPYFNLSWTVREAKAIDSSRISTRRSRSARTSSITSRRSSRPADDRYLRQLAAHQFRDALRVTNPRDDFAEAFASYVHTVLMKKPFEIRIYRDGKVAKVYEACWTEQRCAEKKSHPGRLAPASSAGDTDFIPRGCLLP